MLARKSTDAQVLLPALATAALVDISTGRHSVAEARLGELLPLIRTFGTPSAPYLVPALGVALDVLGRGGELLELDAENTPTPWSEAASAYVSGEYSRAADIYAQIGSRPDEGWARLRAAETHSGGRREAEYELASALEFFRAVGATAYLRCGEEVERTLRRGVAR